MLLRRVAWIELDLSSLCSKMGVQQHLTREDGSSTANSREEDGHQQLTHKKTHTPKPYLKTEGKKVCDFTKGNGGKDCRNGPFP